MTQVWMIRNSDTDIHLFNRFEHVRPSVDISFSRCTEVVVEAKWSTYDVSGTCVFTVTGKRGDGTAFKEEITVKRYPVWTEPSHL